MKTTKKKKSPPKKFSVRVVDLFIRKVPQHVRDNFKAYCSRRGISMKDRLIEMMIMDCNDDVRVMSNAGTRKKKTIEGHKEEEE